MRRNTEQTALVLVHTTPRHRRSFRNRHPQCLPSQFRLLQKVARLPPPAVSGTTFFMRISSSWTPCARSYSSPERRVGNERLLPRTSTLPCGSCHTTAHQPLSESASYCRRNNKERSSSLDKRSAQLERTSVSLRLIFFTKSAVSTEARLCSV